MLRMIKQPVLLLGLVMAAAACSDSTAASAVAGNYSATTFLTGSTGQTNQLTLGSTLTLNLAANGTGGNPAVDADMSGTWTQTGAIIDFSQAVDTFVRNMAFTVATTANGVVTLAGDQVFTGGRVQVILTRA